MKNILIIGATSAIALATARQYAQAKHKLFITGRSQEKLEQIAADLKVRGANEVIGQVFDAADLNSHTTLVEQVISELKQIDIVLIAHGTLPDQERCQQGLDYALQEFNLNGTSIISLCTLLANQLEQQQSGSLAVISSVAGDRGRQSNYLYGTAKAAVSTFLQGLRNRLHKSNVQVLTIKPGFVDTPMTAEFDKGPLWATPEQVANDIIKAIEKGRNTLYTPWFWFGIMTIIKSVPEFIFKKLSL